MDLSRLRAGMNRLAGAVKRTDTTTPLMWGEWAVVEDPNIPSVVLESDWKQTPRPVRNAAGRLEQYQRVYVLHQGPITTIVANPGSMPEPNTLRIGGVDYPASGVWPQETLGTPEFTDGAVYAWTLTKPLPYTPPSGWQFVVDVRLTSGFTTAAWAAQSGNTVRVINVGTAAPTIRLGWRLVKA